MTVSIDVRNTGARAGDEVVQLYVHPQASGVKRPASELRGFRRATLQPGETRKLSFDLPAGKLAFYDVKTHAFVVEPGAFDVMVGGSSGDIRAKGQIEVKTGAR